MQFENSTILGYFQLHGGNRGLIIEPEDVGAISSTTIVAMSKFLGDSKSQDTPVSLVIEDLKGNFLMAGIVEYHPNEEDASKPGNWSYVMTFDEKDVENTTIYKSNDSHFQRYVANALYTMYNASFTDNNSLGHLQQCVIVFATSLIEWLNNNAEAEDRELVFEKYFIARTGVEDGTIIKSITPDEETKIFIKGDATIQK